MTKLFMVCLWLTIGLALLVVWQETGAVWALVVGAGEIIGIPVMIAFRWI
jgi:hypothetical protein